ncbi:basic helix-loop-helix family member e40 [Cricetulus griseus]
MGARQSGAGPPAGCAPELSSRESEGPAQLTRSTFLPASVPPTQLGRTRAALPPPLSGKGGRSRRHLGPEVGVGGALRSRQSVVQHAQAAQRAHTASLCAEREPEAAGTPGHARPQLSDASKPRLLAAQLIARELRLAQRNIPLETLGSSLPGQSSLGRSAKCRQERAVAPARRIMERIPSAQPPPACLPKAPGLEHGDLSGMDFAHMYQVYKSRRGIKRSEDSKETYKLPHRLIEKKRRDRINECIAQLKDLLPEHLKLTTLGHLEKAVVLELTLKHVKALTNLIDQQQQKIIALQSGLQAGELSGRNIEAGQEMFCSGFQTCAREVLQYLAKHENTRDLKSSQLVTHLHRVVSELLQGGTSRKPSDSAPKAMDFKEKPSFLAKGSEGPGKNCVPVIQRTFAPSGGEQSGSDTDTDSGYGGELEKGDLRSEQSYFKSDHGRRFTMGERVSTIKQESEEPPTKKSRMQLSEEEGPFTGSDLMGSPFLGPHPHQPPFCLPFYLIPPSATAYLPMLEKCWYPTSVPVLDSMVTGDLFALKPDQHKTDQGTVNFKDELRTWDAAISPAPKSFQQLQDSAGTDWDGMLSVGPQDLSTLPGDVIGVCFPYPSGKPYASPYPSWKPLRGLVGMDIKVFG